MYPYLSDYWESRVKLDLHLSVYFGRELSLERRHKMFEKFKNFDEMITPGIIKIIYWISMVFVALASIMTLVGSLIAGEFEGILGAILIAIFGFLMVRVYCELIILGFKAVDYLKNINRKLDALNNRDPFNDY